MYVVKIVRRYPSTLEITHAMNVLQDSIPVNSQGLLNDSVDCSNYWLRTFSMLLAKQHFKFDADEGHRQTHRRQQPEELRRAASPFTETK